MNEILAKELLGQNSVDSISSTTGVKGDQVTQLVRTALPILLAGMRQNAESEEGAQSLAAALEAHAGDTKGSTAQMLASADVKDGEKAVQHILGDHSKEITQGLSKQTGITSKQVMSVLGTLVPVLLALLGSNSETGKGNQVDSGGLGGVLTSLLMGSNSKKTKSSDDGLNLASIAGALLGGGSGSGDSGDLLSAAGNLLGGLLGDSGSSGKKENSSADALSSLLGGLLK